MEYLTASNQTHSKIHNKTLDVILFAAQPLSKPLKIYDSLYNKSDFCSIIRYEYGSEISEDAISLIPLKFNESAIAFYGILCCEHHIIPFLINLE